MDHDRLFKGLLTTFFPEFLELFCPELAKYLDPDSLEFLDKEVFTDVTEGERHEVDLVARARFRGKALGFLVHVEAQSQRRTNFPRRMFTYFARFHEKYGLPVYPIAVFSYQAPQQAEPNEYRIDFPDLAVLAFRFHVVQLNQLAWQEFEKRTSPIVAALMANMQRTPAEGARVKLACLRMLARLQLDPARRELISGFVDSYLRLTIEQEQEFKVELQELHPREREDVMEIVTSWMEKGLEQGLKQGVRQGLEQGERRILLRVLRRQFGGLDLATVGRIESLSTDRLEELSEALPDLSSPTDLDAWLESHG
jgi:hypothetical protein